MFLECVTYWTIVGNNSCSEASDLITDHQNRCGVLLVSFRVLISAQIPNWFVCSWCFMNMDNLCWAKLNLWKASYCCSFPFKLSCIPFVYSCVLFGVNVLTFLVLHHIKVYYYSLYVCISMMKYCKFQVYGGFQKCLCVIYIFIHTNMKCLTGCH